ncbi:cytochrome oxidase biogenesis protein Sco1/SenC/PrrC [Blastochloris viridis]|uniref:Cytochrome oxidase biogenesis protein Sco1/SenC/PrrC n=1 Tax=Blastochloris viridis TaxID=1079 RepID=A0A182D0Y7_BLAVI|nr:cytochrome oxidase biogenesis protein Sco1/SenC/PrrC [Blastochloris viridis]
MFVVLAAVGILAGAGVGLWLMNGERGSSASASAVGGPFRLTAHDGRTVTEGDFRGMPILVFFGFTHCPDICPTTLFEVSEMMGRLGADASRTQALFVTVDPERDTSEVLASYLGSFHPRILGLRGDAAATADIVRAFRVYAKKVPLASGDYTMDHTAVVYLMDKDGRFVAPFNLKRPPEAAAAEFRRYF